MITLQISNKIKLTGLSPNVEAHLKKALTLPNPMYFKMQAMGKRVYPSMMEYNYWAVSPDKNLLVPRGMRERLEIFFQKEGLEYEVVDQTIKDKRREMFQKTVELRDYQVPLVEEALKHNESQIVVGTGGGKCHAFGTKILMFDGSLKNIEDIGVGDNVMGDDSTPRKVLNTCKGEDKLYKITPVKGTPFTVKFDHILSLKHTMTKEVINIPLNEWIKKSKKWKHVWKLYRVPVDFKEVKTVLEPYFLGIWLADGTQRVTQITKPDIEIENYLRYYAKKVGLFLRVSSYNGKCKSYHITTHRDKSLNPFINVMRSENIINNKHIPENYKINSRYNRLELLAGILDGDGHMTQSGFDYISKDKKLAEDVVFLCRSVGLAAYLKPCFKGIKKLNFIGKYYRVSISGDCSIIPNKIARKRAPKRLQKKSVLVTGFKVRSVGKGKYAGIVTDKNKLYVMGDFTVTHNTIIACELFHRTGLCGTVLVPNTVLLKQFVGEFKKHYSYTPGIIGDGEKEIKEITVATVQGLMVDEKLLQALVAVTGMLIVDECQGFVTKERLRIIESFMPSRIYGLSATPTRSKDDGRTKAIGFYFGNAWVKYETTQLTPKVHAIQTGVEIEAGEYQRMVETMVRSPERNKLIAGLVIGEAVAGRKILVLTKRIEHYKALQEILGDRKFFHYIDSEDKDRNDKLADFKNGDRDYVAIFGTTSLLAVGLDIPSFDTLILACDMKSEVLTVQSCGRILRLFEGKPEPKIIDLWDNRCGVFNHHYFIRRSIYQQKGWEIQVSLDFNNK